MTSSPSSLNRLSIAHLLFVTTGISVAFFVARSIETLRFVADAHYYNLESVRSIDVFGMLVASIYGLSVTMSILAIRTGNFWMSPGKTLAFLFATMCLLNWGLDIIAAIVTNARMQTEIASGTTDGRGYIFGIWYRSFAVDVGYVACMPILLWTQFKTRRQGLRWRLAWAGFLLFAMAIVAYVHFGLQNYLVQPIDFWFFEAAIGIPICLIISAYVYSIARRDEIDFWTSMTVIPIAFVWSIGIAMKYFA